MFIMKYDGKLKNNVRNEIVKKNYFIIFGKNNEYFQYILIIYTSKKKVIL